MTRIQEIHEITAEKTQRSVITVPLALFETFGRISVSQWIVDILDPPPPELAFIRSNL